MKTVNYDYHEPDISSSAISDIWYASDTRELYVKFRSSGSIAGYLDVPFDLARDFVHAASVGEFYAAKVRGKFKGTTGDVNLVRRSVTAPVSTKKTFSVSGSVVINVTENIFADSLEDAIRIFRDSYNNAEVTGASKV